MGGPRSAWTDTAEVGVSDAWSEIAARYAEVTGDVRQRFLHPAIIAVARDLPRRGRCLDFGCGPGGLTSSFVPHFGEVVAVDEAPDALTQTRARLGGRAHVLDPSAFAATSTTFDAIVLSLVLTTIPTDADAAALLAGLARRLKPEGRLLVGTTHPCFTFRALSQVAYGTSCASYVVPITPGLEVTEYHRPLESIVGLLSGAGLRIIEAKEVYDDEAYYRERGEEPHRFAGLLPMFLILVCSP